MICENYYNKIKHSFRHIGCDVTQLSLNNQFMNKLFSVILGLWEKIHQLV